MEKKNGPACNVTVNEIKMNAEQISEAAGPSVFLLETYDKNGKKFAYGSTFFIEKGVAVTNYHVINNAHSAKAKTSDGKEYDVSSVLGYDKERDIAILEIAKADYPPLKLADSSKVKTGQKIFCLGNPLNLQHTISEGVVFNSNRVISGQPYIQISAPISPGSSGGAVLNERCQVIGIATLAYEGGQLVNFAVPSNAIGDVKRLESGVSLKSSAATDYYKDNVRIPDYGIVTGAALHRAYGPSEDGIVSRFYYYNEKQFETYVKRLAEYGFYVSETKLEDGILYIFFTGPDLILLSFEESANMIAITYKIDSAE